VREIVKQLWPEIDWIENLPLREQVTQVWIKALERSPLQAEDLNQIPFTLLVANCPYHVHGAQTLRGTHCARQRKGHAGVHGTRPTD
jgi:hypothetical protein